MACGGLPAALVPVAPEQERVARTFAAAGVAITGADVEELIERLADPGVRDGLARRGPAVIDGYGAFRVRDALRAILGGGSPPEPVRYRPATAEDSGVLRDWRNDPEARAASRTIHEIEIGEHERWLAGVLADPRRPLFVAETADGPAGSVRFDIEGDEAEISIVVAPERRSGGLGTRIVGEASELMLAAFPALRRVRAEIGEGNERSIGAFRRAGFGAAGDDASPLFLDRAALASRRT
jgi:RimJ/RimL family protein N-acetyltransferase